MLDLAKKVLLESLLHYNWPGARGRTLPVQKMRRFLEASSGGWGERSDADSSMISRLNRTPSMPCTAVSFGARTCWQGQDCSNARMILVCVFQAHLHCMNTQELPVVDFVVMSELHS